MISHRFVEYLHDQVGTPVHDEMLVFEFGVRVDYSENLHDLFHSVQIPQLALQRGDDVERAVSGGIVSLFHGHAAVVGSQRPRDQCPVGLWRVMSFLETRMISCKSFRGVNEKEVGSVLRESNFYDIPAK
mmetsp:Transcript_7833/g.16930  ORF Transcript_7833/g.16930 Transcript_7833/m.16930 type:complete len:130 (+) Transcript_7833:586-975(+)